MDVMPVAVGSGSVLVATGVVGAAVVFVLVGVALAVADVEADALDEAGSVRVTGGVLVAQVGTVGLADTVPVAVVVGDAVPVAVAVGVVVAVSVFEALADVLAVADFEAEADAEAGAVLPHEGTTRDDAADAEGRTSTVPYSSEPAPTESATAAVSLRGLVKGLLTKDVVS